MPRSLAALVAALTLAAAPAFAGIIDTPLPAGAAYLYSVPGVINSGGLATYFSCSSTSTDPQSVTVEAFDQTGAAAGSASLVVAAGQAVLFGTQDSIYLTENMLLASPVISIGTARILSTAKSKVLCSAFVANVAGAPAVMEPLTIVAKTKQKAAN